MKNSIGGLFKQKKQADQAYSALQEAGFHEGELTMWVHKKEMPLNDNPRVSLLEIGMSAAIGAVVGGLIAAIIGGLISLGGIQIPGFRPDFTRGEYVEAMAFALFIVQGAITGAILGAAIRLFTSRRNARFTSRGIKRGGVLVVVNAEDAREETAKRVMKENGALDLENLTEKWDTKVWDEFRQVEPSVGS
ncbi:MAG TPA: hypothetical protein VFZ43_02730 [Anaerolineales bacterium]